MKVEINLPDPPEGYEYTGEFRPAHDGELYLTRYNKFAKWDHKRYSTNKFITLKPVAPPWQPPTGILRPGWVVIDLNNGEALNGEVWWCPSKPEWNNEYLEWTGGELEEITRSVNIEWPNITGEKAIWQVE
jgi:hypothetical protein